MGLLVAIFGGVLVYGAFSDNKHGVPVWDAEHQWSVIIGAVLIVAGLLYAAVSRED